MIAAARWIRRKVQQHTFDRRMIPYLTDEQADWGNDGGNI